VRLVWHWPAPETWCRAAAAVLGVLVACSVPALPGPVGVCGQSAGLLCWAAAAAETARTGCSLQEYVLPASLESWSWIASIGNEAGHCSAEVGLAVRMHSHMQILSMGTAHMHDCERACELRCAAPARAGEFRDLATRLAALEAAAGGAPLLSVAEHAPCDEPGAWCAQLAA
jgi:hypothetical protein